jgi:serine/threonine-protein kinase
MSPLFSADRWKTLEPLLDAAVELPPERRATFVDDACSADSMLRAELVQLLEEYDRHDTLLERPAAERFATLLDQAPMRLPDLLDGRYRIEREVGRGGMATVYLARDIRHERNVAVKILHPELAVALGTDRFLAEIRTTAQLQHPHILPLYDSGQAEGLLFYVMPYVEGESLRRRLERERQLPIDEAVRIAREVAAAVDSAHRHGVIHRDIKPENILLRDGSALVADFGIALAVSAAAAPRLTQPGRIVGTPQYMSPEQASAEGVIDTRTDVYALGTVLYEMLVGEPPFTGPTATMVLAKRSATTAPSARMLRQTIPTALDAAMVRALARDPADRYQTAGEFGVALEGALLPGAPGDARRLPSGQSFPRRLGMAVFALLILSLGVATVARLVRSTGAASAPDPATATYGSNSIAVLPFAGNDSANVFFAQGMTDALSSALDKVPGVRVVSATSVPRVSTRATDPRVIGRTLRVAKILQGSIQRADDQLRVVIHLLDTADGRTLWSNEYTPTVTRAGDIFAVEDDIVRDVIKQLRITLSGQSASLPVRRPTENLQAYNQYLQGKLFQDQGGVQSQAKALEYFEQAIGTDSNFSQAYSGIADVYIAYGIGNAGDYPPDEYFPKARTAARRALAIDSTSAEALTADAKVKLLYDFDWLGAEREFARALDVDPHYMMARTYRTVLLEFTGRFDSAMVEARAALEDEPLSTFVKIEASRALLFGRKYDQAIELLRQILEADSTHFRARMHLGQAFEQSGQLDSAVAEMQQSVRFNPKSSRPRAFLAHAYALAGRTTDALRELGVMQQQARHGYVPAFDFAVVYAGLGGTDECFKWLDRAFDEHSIRPYLMDPTFDAIRSDPRYQRLLGRMHHPLAVRNASKAQGR